MNLEFFPFARYGPLDIQVLMPNHELARAALELPISERLDLARQLIESVGAGPLTEKAKEGIRRIEDVASGREAGLKESEYRAALG